MVTIAVIFIFIVKKMSADACFAVTLVILALRGVFQSANKRHGLLHPRNKISQIVQIVLDGGATWVTRPMPPSRAAIS